MIERRVVAANWQVLETSPNVDWEKNHHGFACESCGIYLYARGGYQVPGLNGRYCSVACAEQAAFGSKKFDGAFGHRLLLWIKERDEKLYLALTVAQESCGEKWSLT